jgi:hypothetical protein
VQDIKASNSIVINRFLAMCLEWLKY